MKNATLRFVWISAVLVLMTESIAPAQSAFDSKHSTWGRVLKTHVRNARMDYGALQASSQDLNEYLSELSEITQAEYNDWSRAEKLAFWINAYNAATLHLILNHYPIRKSLSLKAFVYPSNSIQQIPKVWDREAITLLDRRRSLNFIEHEVLRAEFKEPRIHFVFVCASVSCPDLLAEPYVGERLEMQLKAQTKAFIQNTQKNRMDEQGVLHLSKIFEWFGEDFDEGGGIRRFIKDRLPKAQAYRIHEQTPIRWLDYDWRLNDTLNP